MRPSRHPASKSSDPRPAVFLDRDGTINCDSGYVAREADVELIPRAAGAIRRLNHAGIPVVVVTNQSGIARGYFTESDYSRVRARLDEVLAAHGGARIDATYTCPHLPEISGPCECRKPGTLLFRQAASEMNLDLGASFFFGDKLRDILPAKELGGRGILIPSPETPDEDLQEARRAFAVAYSLDEAVGRVLESRR